MDYKKEYEQALERAKVINPGTADYEVAVKIFPELKESNDKKIRKALIHLISEQDGFLTAINGISVKDILAWLEKQGEVKEYTFKSLPRLLDIIEPTSRAKTYCQKLIDSLVKEGYITDAKIVGKCLKRMNGEDVPMVIMDEKKGEQNPVNKVEPKFNVGDWIISSKGTLRHIVAVDKTGYETDEGWLTHDIYEKDFHLWTIQDAKVGDVLCIHSSESDYDCVFLYQNTYEIEPNRNVAVAYCCIYVYANKIEFGIQGPDCIDVRNVGVPATKEQCDLLFQKMKEAGYEWDDKKKELKKIEQKPTDNVEPKFKVGDTIVEKDFDECGCGTIVNIKDGKYIFDDGCYTWIKEQGLWQLVEQKPTEKVEPKFNAGDWVIYECGEDSVTLQIKNTVYGTYEFTDNSTLNVVDENTLRLWTIQDAKECDVLATENGPFIFKGFLDEFFPEYPVAYCGIDSERMFHIPTIKNCYWTGLSCLPATKEQRDLLFQKMHEAGYEWDAEKKELKKIEQKPTDKVEPKFKVGDWVVQTGVGTFRIIEVCKTWYEVVDYAEMHYSIAFSLESDCRLWSIQDAKDGDVLYLQHDGKEHIIIYKGVIKERLRTFVSAYCAYNGFVHNFCFADVSTYACITSERDEKEICPATKEQRDLLFSKMKEAGYEWDVEKKELKKIEQKPTDKVEPKFKIDDWVIDKDNIWKICNISLKTYYELLNVNNDVSTRRIEDVDKTARLWTIQDAKEGDVLANGNIVLIFKCFEEPSYKQHIIAYIGLDASGQIQVTNESWNLGLDSAKPATKEQRNLLFQKMKEYGYEWDAERKELKKIEKKPAEWSEEDEKMLADACIMLDWYKGNNWWTAQYIKDWLKSLKERMKGGAA